MLARILSLFLLTGFTQESSVVIPLETRAQFEELHRILKALRSQDIGPALTCVLLIISVTIV